MTKGRDDDAQAATSVLQFPSSATAVRKSSGQVQIPVTRTGPANRTATVAYSLSGGASPGKDNTAPVLLAKAGVLKRGVLRVRFSCNEACSVRASVRLRGKTVGTATDSLSRAGTGRLRIRLKEAGRTARRSKLTLRLTARDRAGNTRSLSLPLG